MKESAKFGKFSVIIPITPAMVDAGIDILRGFDVDYDDEKDTVIELFQAMLAASDDGSH